MNQTFRSRGCLAATGAALPALLPFTQRVCDWLRCPDHVHRRWLSATPVCAAWLGLLLAVLTPPHGTGFTVCWLHQVTGLPCPGCGLTRSLSCGLRGMFLESWQYHPLGLVILTLLVAIAASSLLPPCRRANLRRCLESHALTFNALYLAFVAGFLAFGLGRTLMHLPQCLGPR